LALALFDIDGTLVAGPSTEKRLFLALLRGGWLGPRQLGHFVGFAARRAHRFGRHVFKKDKAYLAGLPVAEVQQFASEWVARHCGGWWYAPCVARLRTHQAAGDQVMLLSGAPGFVARAIADQLGVARALGTECAVAAGRFLPDAPRAHPFAEEKLRMAAALCAELRTAPADLVAYGDSIHDLPVLSFAGRAVAVRPDAGLTAAARAAGWEILGDRHG